MIIHHSENLKNFHICIHKPLKYSESFTFIPFGLQKNDKLIKCILQTPLMFTPFGIQTTKNNKQVIDISFQNNKNDDSYKNFIKSLQYIYRCVYYKFKDTYKVNEFLKNTDFNECIRLKLTDNTSLYDESKNSIDTIDKFTYGYYIIELEGLWINNNDLWFQWNLLQAKVRLPTHLYEYSFIDEIHDKQDEQDLKTISDKYDKMLKMGVPKEAVDRQRLLDGYKGKSKSNIHPPGMPPPPGIPPPPGMPPPPPPNKSNSIPKINASDLQNVVLKKGKPIHKKEIKKDPTNFEPPTLEELQTTLSRLRKTR